jgi:hypothetical protein
VKRGEKGIEAHRKGGERETEREGSTGLVRTTKPVFIHAEGLVN